MYKILIILLIGIIPITLIAAEEEDFNEGVRAFNSGERLEAQGIFEKFVADYPDSKLIPNCIYYLARLENNSQRALEFYNMIWQEYSKSDVADDALFEIAQYYYATAEYNTAIEKYRKLVSSYKKSEYACDAQYWMANALFAIGDYEKALEEYRNVNVKFPGCNKNASAELEIARTHYKLGNLRDASVQYRTILSEKKDPGILAAALYGLGECSEKNAQIEQAIYSYERLVEDFPTSQEAAQAKLRLTELKKQYYKKPHQPKKQPTYTELSDDKSQKPKEKNGEGYTIQAGAFRDETNANQMVKTLQALGYDAKISGNIDDKSAAPYKVWVGFYKTREEAEKAKSKLEKDSPDISTFIVKLEK